MDQPKDLTTIPKAAMPRERLKKFGTKVLATHELLAIILRTGTQDLNVLELALGVLNTFEDLFSLKMATLEELMEIKGIGPAKAIELKAAIELGSRLNEAKQVKLGTILSSENAGLYIQEDLKDAYQEKLMCLFLNTKNEIIKKKVVFKGGLNSSLAHPREIFREAVRNSGAKLIVGHNHPSGILTPSQADIDFTQRLIQCGRLMGIEVLDHFIVSQEGYLSLREEGFFD